MRADRLVSLVLLLRQRGRLSAAAIAKELEVSTRTVLRDIDALSSAGIPVYAERGRHGGFSLLPDFTTDLTGLNHEEALALLVAGSRLKAGAFGLGAPLASAMLKVIDALPGPHRDTAAGVAERFLIEPEADLLARPLHTPEDIDAEVVTTIRSAVLNKHKVRIRYTAPGAEPSWRTIDPIGLVSAAGLGYLLAFRNGEDRTYRLSRIREAEHSDQPAELPDDIDLDELWKQRSRRFRHGENQITVDLRISRPGVEELTGTTLAIRTQEEADGWVRAQADFQDARHAEWALWQLNSEWEILGPRTLRESLYRRAAGLARRLSPSHVGEGSGLETTGSVNESVDCTEYGTRTRSARAPR